MRKMDEMEREMNDKSIRHSWLFGIISLLVLNIYNLVKTDTLHWSFTIMLLMFIIYRLSYILQQYQKGDKSAPATLIWVIVTVILTLIIGFIMGKVM